MQGLAIGTDWLTFSVHILHRLIRVVRRLPTCIRKVYGLAIRGDVLHLLLVLLKELDGLAVRGEVLCILLPMGKGHCLPTLDVLNALFRRILRMLPDLLIAWNALEGLSAALSDVLHSLRSS